jgi:hypothetical protein
MRIQITGTRDGVRWPAPGGVVDLPDHEAARLCANGRAEPVADVEEKSEHATRPAPELRSRRAATPKPVSE